MNKPTKETITAALSVLGMLALFTALAWVASIEPRPSFFVFSGFPGK